MVLECWIDGVRPDTNEKAAILASEIKASGIGHAMIILNNQSNDDVPKHLTLWRTPPLVSFVKALFAAGIPEVSLTVWPAATRAAVDETLADLRRLRKAFVASSVAPKSVGINIDAEGKYDKTGWGAGGGALASYFCKGLDELNMGPLSLTTIPFKGGPRPQDLALMESGVFSRFQPQTYSQYQGHDHWSAASFFRPGIIQEHTAKQWRQMHYGYGGAFSTGIMVIAQNHPAPSPKGHEALSVALHAAAETEFYDRVAIWSWRHWRRASPFVRTAVSAGAVKVENSRLVGPAKPAAPAPEMVSFIDGVFALGRGRARALKGPDGQIVDALDIDAQWELIKE